MLVQQPLEEIRSFGFASQSTAVAVGQVGQMFRSVKPFPNNYLLTRKLYIYGVKPWVDDRSNGKTNPSCRDPALAGL